MARLEIFSLIIMMISKTTTITKTTTQKATTTITTMTKRTTTKTNTTKKTTKNMGEGGDFLRAHFERLIGLHFMVNFCTQNIVNTVEGFGNSEPQDKQHI